MRTIFMLKGIPASGKSTWAKQQIQKYPGKYKRINKDDLRAMMDDNQWSRKNEAFTIGIRDDIIAVALAKGYDVIVDDTNFNEAHYASICERAKRTGDVRVLEKYFELSLKGAIDRNEKRLNAVPVGVIHQMYNKHVKNKRIESRDVYYEPVRKEALVSFDSSKKTAVIFDVDGTLAHNYENRSPFDNNRVLEDSPDPHVIELAKIFKDRGLAVVVVSGREDVCKEDTVLWLQANDVPFDEIHMRKAKDYRKDSFVKKEIYEEHIRPYFNILYVLDDRRVCVHMWRDQGLTCLQVDEGLF